MVRRALMQDAGADVLAFEDAASGAVREAYLTGGRLDRLVFLTVGGPLPPREWLVELFALEDLDEAARAALLLGRAPGRTIETGPVVCACRNVRRTRIVAAINGGAATLDAVGEVTTAGTVCGSCRPEIGRLLAATALKEIADAA